MKTTTFELSVRMIFLSGSLLMAAACQKDEFYEKDYLENPYASSVDGGAAAGGVDGGVSGGTVGASVGGTVGGTDGSVTGGTDGSTVGGTTGTVTGSTVGGTDGSTVGGTTGTTTGATVGGTDGSTAGGTVGGTDGSTAGGTVGGTDGSTAGGTVGGTNGSTVGGTDGSTVGGTTGTTTGATVGGTDGSTAGGTVGGTDGSTAGGTVGGVQQWADESFRQTAEQTKKLDIIWVMDSSGSMAEEQQALADNFSVFIDDFIDMNVDFKMGITTTDMSTSQRAGAAVSGSLDALTSVKAQQNETLFKNNFKNMIKVGISGSGNEQGLAGSTRFIERYQQSWMRSDAYLAVVYISDEEDQSPLSKEAYLAKLRAAKSSAGAGYVKAYSIVDQHCVPGQYGIDCGFARYAFQSTETNGTVADIRSNFAQVLRDMGEQIITLLDSFPLAHDPISGSIEVKVNGVVKASGWSVTNRQLKFDAGSLPPVGATISVRYRY